MKWSAHSVVRVRGICAIRRAVAAPAGVDLFPLSYLCCWCVSHQAACCRVHRTAPARSVGKYSRFKGKRCNGDSGQYRNCPRLRVPVGFASSNTVGFLISLVLAVSFNIDRPCLHSQDLVCKHSDTLRPCQSRHSSMHLPSASAGRH